MQFTKQIESFHCILSRNNINLIIAKKTIYNIFKMTGVIFFHIAQCLASSTMFILLWLYSVLRKRQSTGKSYSIVKTAYNAVVRYVHREKNPTDLSREILRQKSTGRLFMVENYFLVKPRIRRHIIYALLSDEKKARGSEEKCTSRAGHHSAWITGF